MKVLGILGSPRKGGNSEILLKAFLEGAAAGRRRSGGNLASGEEDFPLHGNIPLF